MREIRKSGSEGGGRKSPYPYHGATSTGRWMDSRRSLSSGSPLAIPVGGNDGFKMIQSLLFAA